MSTPLSTLKIRVAAVISTLTLALVSTVMSAQMQEQRSQVNISFDFEPPCCRQVCPEQS
jgi:hypothetical protein